MAGNNPSLEAQIRPPTSDLRQQKSEASRKIGAVMVVGGGVAGMQASLDLAEAGFKVYLVESKSAIGGHMAQLDKTFPTNDCSMCILSPKLVDAGRHLNIDVLVDSEVVKIDGEAGHFTATVRRKPRYIDLAKCTGCGECENVCPVMLPHPYEEGLATRRAAHRLYPQAVPAAYAIEKIGVAPCRSACPAGQRAQGYIALIAQGRYRDALRVIKQDNPFPSVCGRTCHHPCEGHCTRAYADEAVSIMSLKRFVVDYALAYGRAPVERVPRTRPEWIAIVGAGPAGLTAAHDLALMGYGVTVYEALPVPGGMMRVGIPAHRLPKGVLQQDIDDILALGVVLKTNSPIKDPTELLTQGYNAVCLATGLSTRDPRLGLEGEEAEGVISAATFLRKVNLGEELPPIGNRVVVIGGGITTVDAAAVARRLGAEHVTLALSRPRQELPAYQWEIEAAESEGVKVLEKTTAVRILTQNGRVVGVECARVQAGEVVDESGRRRPRTEPGSEFVVEADTVIRTIGQLSDLCFLDPAFDDLQVDLDTFTTSTPGLFAVAGKKTGAAFIIDAVALGHRVATSIDRYLRGEPLKQARPVPPTVKFTRQEIAERVRRGEIIRQERAQPALLPVEERVTSFREVVLGLTERQARAEAHRCLQCGLCSECLECVRVCGLNAIDHNMVERIESIQVGAVILAPGYEIYDARLAQEYGLGRYANVVTALQYERLLSASGPTRGHVKRPSDSRTPKKIAFLQCIGSRDQQHDYCSSVCCMYAAKEAIMTKEHDRDADVHIFFMDTRAFSKGYEEYYQRAQKKYGIHYHRTRISALRENPANGNLVLRYVDDRLPTADDSDQRSAVSGQSSVVEQEFDLVVLSVGMEMSDKVKQLGRELGIELDDYGFCHTALFDPLQTSRPGIYVAGPFREPKDIPETVIEASGAAGAAEALLASARGTLTRQAEYPPERDIAAEAPRVGVFVCHCGSNIGGYLDVPAVTEYARTLPGVVHAENNLYTCSQDSVSHITQIIREKNLNRVVVAACTPRTHEPLFQDSLRAAGLNPGLFEMANIRNQCSWVHSDDWEGATHKARDLVRAAVARALRLEPLHTLQVPVERSALVIGGGIAGMTAALALADHGFPVHLVERTAQLGGNLRRVFYLADVQRSTFNVQTFLRELIAKVESHPLITLHLESELVETGGFQGNFASKVQEARGKTTQIQHGVTIVATGGREYRGDEYGLGHDPRVMTQLDFEAMLVDKETSRQVGKEIPTPYSLLPNSVVMILCVGPAEKYCARMCCTTAIKNALKLKELKPDAQVTILYKDIRTYGFKERLYTEARRKGVLFVRYDDEHRPGVEQRRPMTDGRPTTTDDRQPTDNHPTNDQPTNQLTIQVWDPSLGRELTLNADLLVLSNPVIPAEGAHELAQVLKVPVDLDGWFLEAHVKLRPVDFATDGIFMAGLAHYPKFLDETIAQAQAAAARAATILSKDTLTVGGVVAMVDAIKCVGCLTCVRICPYHVPQIRADFTGAGGIIGAAYIEPAACHGCGVCAGECPAKAITLAAYSDAQVMAKVEVLFEEIQVKRDA